MRLALDGLSWANGGLFIAQSLGLARVIELDNGVHFCPPFYG